MWESSRDEDDFGGFRESVRFLSWPNALCTKLGLAAVHAAQLPGPGAAWGRWGSRGWGGSRRVGKAARQAARSLLALQGGGWAAELVARVLCFLGVITLLFSLVSTSKDMVRGT